MAHAVRASRLVETQGFAKLVCIRYYRYLAFSALGFVLYVIVLTLIRRTALRGYTLID